MIRDRILQIGGDKSFDDHGALCVLLIQHAFVEQRSDSIPREERTDLISCQQLHLVAICSNCHAHTIAIGIGGDDEISVLRLRKLDRHC